MNPGRLHFFWRDRGVHRRFRTAVSLHSHTSTSRENLAFIPRYARAVPLLSMVLGWYERGHRRKAGSDVDYSRAWWTPPAGPAEAYHIERAQIEDLDLNPVVSLTDHDDIESGFVLHLLGEGREAPVSVEWTVPYGPSFFHLGIHNLPPHQGRGILAGLRAYTGCPSPGRLAELLSALNLNPEILVVFNHPLWDEAGIGFGAHLELFRAFLERFGTRIHALELNGLRPWAENRWIAKLAAASGHPVVSGGDRHGCEPNGNLNLTNAGTIAEFAAEIRQDRISDVLFLPQYREPLKLRYLESARDILREYPEHPGRARWVDRFFYRSEDESVLPLSVLFSGNGLGLVRQFLGLSGLLRSRRVRSAIRSVLADGQEVAG